MPRIDCPTCGTSVARELIVSKGSGFSPTAVGGMYRCNSCLRWYRLSDVALILEGYENAIEIGNGFGIGG